MLDGLNTVLDDFRFAGFDSPIGWMRSVARILDKNGVNSQACAFRAHTGDNIPNGNPPLIGAVPKTARGDDLGYNLVTRLPASVPRFKERCGVHRDRAV